MDLYEAQALWDPTTVYLDTASYGLPPRPAYDALQTALRDWRHGEGSWRDWLAPVDRARGAFAGMVGAAPEDVAIGSNLSVFAGLVAASLPDGARVLAAEVEFTSNLFPWMTQSERGVALQVVPVGDLEGLIDDSLDLVAVSAVQSASGYVHDLDAISARAREAGVQVFVDATQACGWLPLDATRFDYLAASAYKWLMCPRGTGFMAINPQRLEEIRPFAPGWYAGEDVHDSYYGPPLRLASDARRLDLSPAWFSWVATAPTLELIDGIGVENIRRHNIGLANRFLEGLGREPGASAIVTVDAAERADLLAHAGVKTAVRAGKVRASFHVYNTTDDVDAAIKVLRGD